MLRGFLINESNADAPRQPVESSLVVGRTVDCGMVIDDGAASRRHLEITCREGRFFWKDLNSTNGTRVNDVPMLEGELHHGDRVQVGETVLRFEVAEVTEEPPAEASTLFRQTFLDGRCAPTPQPTSSKAGELLQAVYKVMNDIASNYEPCSLVDRILQTTVGAIQAQRGAVFFAGPPGDELQPCPVCRDVHYIRDGRFGKAEPGAIRISRTIAERVLRQGESVLFQDTAPPADLPISESIANLQLRSIICVPLRGKFGIQGILYLDSDRPSSQYGQEDLLLSSAVGNSAGLALENATMHQQILEKQRTDQEIAYASIIQRGFLVDTWPPGGRRFEVYGETHPAKTVGGDFYDFIEPAEGLVGVLVGDVSGKGVPAALTMAQVLAQFRLHARAERSPARVLRALNQDLVARSQRGMFCTLSYVVLDLKTGMATCANAGHLPAACIRHAAAAPVAGASGPPAGILAETHWEDETIPLGAGDALVLFSDGLTEARKPVLDAPLDAVHEYGQEAILDLLHRIGALPLEEMVKALIASVERFTAPLSPHDDCTVIALRYLG